MYYDPRQLINIVNEQVSCTRAACEIQNRFPERRNGATRRPEPRNKTNIDFPIILKFINEIKGYKHDRETMNSLVDQIVSAHKKKGLTVTRKEVMDAVK